MNAALASTLGNREWMKANHEKLRNLFSRDGDEVDQSFLLRLGFNLKLLGVDWRSNDELIKTLLFLTRVGITTVSQGGKIVYRA